MEPYPLKSADTEWEQRPLVLQAPEFPLDGPAGVIEGAPWMIVGERNLGFRLRAGLFNRDLASVELALGDRGESGERTWAQVALRATFVAAQRSGAGRSRTARQDERSEPRSGVLEGPEKRASGGDYASAPRAALLVHPRCPARARILRAG